MEFRQRLGAMIRTIPPAQQAGIAVALIVLILASVMFFRWVTTPAYTVLYSGLEASQVQSVIDELESQGVPYKLEAAGTQILVPRSEVYEVRASLAAAGIQGTVVPQGYELLDGQSLTITDFQQRVAYQRALEGEIAKTLMAMQPIESATVHLVIPEEPLFEEERKPTTASVLVAPVRPLSDAEVESIISLVSSSVEGLEPSNVTVADAAGTVLHAAGEDATGAGMGSRTLRQTREFEQLLAQDLTSLLTTVLGPGRASVVVRAQLDFDQRTSESETFSKEEPPTLKEQTLEEEFTGAGAAPGGALGVDGGVVATGEATTSTRRMRRCGSTGSSGSSHRSPRLPGPSSVSRSPSWTTTGPRPEPRRYPSTRCSASCPPRSASTPCAGTSSRCRRSRSLPPTRLQSHKSRSPTRSRRISPRSPAPLCC